MSDIEKVTIIMIEDDLGHATLIEKNLRRAGIMNEVLHLDNGRKALDYFQNAGEFESVERPECLLVLLDLNLPEVDGFEVLQQLKSKEETRTIPIIILTTTDNPREVERAYELGCNIYVTKPVVYESFAESIRKLGLMLAVVKLPGE